MRYKQREVTDDNKHLQTYWNGEPTPAFRCVIVIQDGDFRGDPVFRPVQAVEVLRGDAVFYLDNEPTEGSGQLGSGWLKVTQGFGSPRYGHKQHNNVEAVIFRYRSPVYEQEWEWADKL